MFKNTMVWLGGTDTDLIALRTARGFSKRIGGHFEAVHVRPDPVTLARDSAGYDAFGMGTWTEETFEAVRAGIAQTAQHARSGFDRFCKKEEIQSADKPPAMSLSSSYTEIEGDVVPTLIAQARCHDLLVCARSGDIDRLGTLLMGSGRPMLVGADRAGSSGENIAIAWKGTAEAARAVAVSMPILARANTVSIITAVEDESKEAAEKSAADLAETLQWNGIHAKVRCVDTDGNQPDAVVEIADSIRADMLVMGAYGHSRAREFVFGGFTRTLLRECSLPLLLVH
jgi:nucleotide-binding universal stress UspA family protein